MSGGLAVLERRAARIARDLTLAAAPPVARTAVELAGDLGVALDGWQRDALATAARYVILLASRQAGKSTVAALMAVHQAVCVPGSLTLILSPGERQSKLLLRKVSRLYAALRDVAPAASEGRLSLELRNGSAVHALPGKEETIRGFSEVDLLIEDEAAVVPDGLYQAARPMVAVSGGRIVLMSTPRGKRGHFHREYSEGGPEWHRAAVTAYAVPRIDPAWLDAERARIGEYWFRQEYLCEFVDAVDRVFRSEDVRRALSADVAPLFGG